MLDACGGDVEATIRRLDELSRTVAARAAVNGAGPSAEGQQQPDGAPGLRARRGSAPRPCLHIWGLVSRCARRMRALRCALLAAT